MSRGWGLMGEILAYRIPTGKKTQHQEKVNTNNLGKVKGKNSISHH